jgi:NAD(P)-dependent dehydrogenase (short-subunit alcohol dehydrogenase family)
MSIVLITGCSIGIGFVTAEAFAKSGHRVYATMRNPQNSPNLQILSEEQNLPITILSMDVNSEQSVKEAIESILSKEGFIDVLVNNAGIASTGAVEELPIEFFRSTMETNYFGTLRCIKEVLPLMRERKRGCIINVCSVAGRLFSYFHAPYCASKAALEALSECLAQEVHPFNIRVAIVEPGIVKTALFAKVNGVNNHTHYSNIKRFKAFFKASLEKNISPTVVAEVILEIAEDNSYRFRNPAGPDAMGLINWRTAMSDEDWLSSQNIEDDERWAACIEERFNLNVKRHFK